MDYTTTDLEQYAKKQVQVIETLHLIDQQDYETKKEYVIRLIEVTRPLVHSGRIPGVKPNQLAEHISSVLTMNNISYSRTGEYFYSLFEENEKHSHGTNLSSHVFENHEHEFKVSSDPRLTICECGQIIFNNLPYDVQPVKEDPVAEKMEAKVKEMTYDEFSDPISEYFARIKLNCNLLAKIAQDLLDKFWGDDPSVTGVLKDFYPQPQLLAKDQKSLQAKLLHIAKLTDFRHKIGPFEKIKALLLMETTFNVAKVARMLHITPKHATNNILKNSSQMRDTLDWFNEIDVMCPNCKTHHSVSLGHWYDEQLIRKEIGLTLTQPFS